MMFLQRLFLYLILFCITTTCCMTNGSAYGLSIFSSFQNNWGKCCRRAVASVALVGAISTTTLPNNNNLDITHAEPITTTTTTTTTKATDDNDDNKLLLLDKLKPPSEDQPQIQLPTKVPIDNVQTIIGNVNWPGQYDKKYIETEVDTTVFDSIEGDNDNNGDDSFTEILFISVYKSADVNNNIINTNDNELLLAGAKIPVSRVKFPFNFKMTIANAAPSLSSPDIFANAMASEDLYLEAKVCSISDKYLLADNNQEKNANNMLLLQACPTKNSRVFGATVSKFFTNIPGWDPNAPTKGFRAPVSLVME